MKRFLIPATLLLILLTVLSCGNSDNVLLPTTDAISDADTGVLAELKSDTAIFAAPPNGKGKKEKPGGGKSDGTLIGPAGGIVDAGHNSYLLVPAGALTEDIAISAKSTDSAITTNPGEIEQNLQNAITLIKNKSNYIKALPKKDDGSGVWIAKNAKNWLAQRNGYILEYANNGLLNHQAHNGWEALRQISLSLGSVDDFEWDIDFQSGHVGPTAKTELLAMCAQIRSALQQADALYEGTLLFEFAPHGTQFLIPAELVVPLEEVSISDEFAWYSAGATDSAEITSTDYFVDEVEGTVHYFVNHFSIYYYRRR